ncbi:glycoside hydrolase family 95-like protein [Planctomycetota bacterium]
MNRSDRFEYYVKLVNFWLDAARKNAREVYDLPGMCLIHGYIPPIKPDEYPHTTASFELAMGTPAMVMKLLWDTWDYGGDELFLKEKVYPALKDLAIFYSEYVKKGDDDYYHVQPTVAQERWGITYQFRYNTDATESLAMIKWTLTRAAEAAKVLGLDLDMQSKWLTIARDIAPYPTVSMPEGPILTAVPGDTILQNSRHNGKLAPANLADEINLDSKPADIELALRTARRNPDDRDASMVFHLLGADCGIAYPWIGGSVGHLDTLNNHNALVNAYWAEPERLVNSRSGRIHLFPCVPDSATVAFKDFQASEGFLVSAECWKGRVTYFNIKSRRDVECRIANTWLNDKKSQVTVIRESDNIPIKVDVDNEYNDGIVFQAQKGESYFVTESR